MQNHFAAADPAGPARLSRRPVCAAIALALALAGGQVHAAVPDRFERPGAGLDAARLLAQARTQPDSMLGKALADPRLAGALQRLENRARSERGGVPVVEVENCNDSGPGSLRAALAGMTENGIVDLTQLTCSRISLDSGALNLPSRGYEGLYVAIEGPGANRLTIDGNHQSPVFTGSKYSTMLLSGVTVANGRNVGSQFAAGGCIAMPAGQLYLIESTVRDCQVEGGDFALGGGVSAQMVMAKYSEVSGNTVSGNDRVLGGGVAGKYHAMLISSTISGNSVATQSPDPDQARYMGGGGIGSKYQVLAINSVVGGNSVQAQAGDVGGGGLLGQRIMAMYSQLAGNTVVSGDGISVGGGARAFHRVESQLPQIDPADLADLAGVPGLAGVDLDSARLQNLWRTWRRSRVSHDGAVAGGGGPSPIDPAYLGVGNSEVSGNRADFGGGLGLHGDITDAPIGNVRGANSTISGNQLGAGGLGGGIAVTTADVTLDWVTLADNQGDGIRVEPITGAVQFLHLNESILADNAGDDIATAGPLAVSGGRSLVRTWDPLTLTLPGDTISADPVLQPLAINGGWQTRTHALGPGSPALDAGGAEIPPDGRGITLPPQDQRGWPFLRQYGSARDLGAYEYNDILFANGWQLHGW